MRVVSSFFTPRDAVDAFSCFDFLHLHIATRLRCFFAHLPRAMPLPMMLPRARDAARRQRARALPHYAAPRDAMMSDAARAISAMLYASTRAKARCARCCVPCMLQRG